MTKRITCKDSRGEADELTPSQERALKSLSARPHVWASRTTAAATLLRLQDRGLAKVERVGPDGRLRATITVAGATRAAREQLQADDVRPR